MSNLVHPRDDDDNSDGAVYDDDGQSLVDRPAKKKPKRDDDTTNADGDSSTNKEVEAFLSSLQALGASTRPYHEDSWRWADGQWIEHLNQMNGLQFSTSSLIEGNTSDIQTLVDFLSESALLESKRQSKFKGFLLQIHLDSPPNVTQARSDQLIGIITKLVRVPLPKKCVFWVPRLDCVSATMISEIWKSMKDVNDSNLNLIHVDLSAAPHSLPIEEINTEAGLVFADNFTRIVATAVPDERYPIYFLFTGSSRDGSERKILVKLRKNGIGFYPWDWPLNAPFLLGMVGNVNYHGMKSLSMEVKSSSVEMEPAPEAFGEFMTVIKNNTNRTKCRKISLTLWSNYGDREYCSPELIHSLAAVVQDSLCPLKRLSIQEMTGNSREHVEAAKHLLQAFEMNQTSASTPIQELEVALNQPLHTDFALKLVRRALHLKHLTMEYHDLDVYSDCTGLSGAWKAALNDNKSLESLLLQGRGQADILTDEEYEPYLQRNKANKWASRVSTVLDKTHDPKLLSAIIPHALKRAVVHLHEEPIAAASVEKLHKQCLELCLILQRDDKDHDKNTMIEDEA